MAAKKTVRRVSGNVGKGASAVVNALAWLGQATVSVVEDAVQGGAAGYKAARRDYKRRHPTYFHYKK